MFAFLTLRRKARLLIILVVSLLLAACQGGGGKDGRSVGKIIDKPVIVALLVPSGSTDPNNVRLALSIESAARLALADSGTQLIDLRVYQTAGNAETARDAAQKALGDGAVVILGPVYAQEARAAATVAATRGVNVLSFSNNTDIAGGNLFILGTNFENIADRLARFALRQGRSRFVSVHEDNPQGALGNDAISKGVDRAGGYVVASIAYPFSQPGVIAAPPRIAEAVAQTQADTLFLTADTSGALPLLSQLLPENGLSRDKVQLIGLSRWDIPAATLSLPGVQGGWFALPDPALYTRFQAHFQTNYSSIPHPISGLAYDGINAFATLLAQGTPDPFGKVALTQERGFVGVSGIFRLRDTGLTERAMAIGRVTNGEVIVIDPAQSNFAFSGF